MKVFFAVLTFLLGVPVFAQSCEGIQDEYDQGYCFNKQYSQIDDELNRTYEELTSLLSKAQKKTLKKIQLEWIKSRDTSCSLKADNRFYVDVKCATNITTTQNEFLRDQIDMCKAGTCGIAADDEVPDVIPKGKYKASYFNGKKFVSSEIVDAISIHYPYSEFKGIPSSSFRATWETDIEAKEEKTLILSVSVSWSSVSVFVNDEKLVGWANNSKELPIKVSKGVHRIKLEYSNNWHTVNFNASFSVHPKVMVTDATQQISPLVKGNTKTIYIGAYEAKNIYNQVVVSIKNSKYPIILFLSSYEAINWKIENPSRVSIKGIFFDSYDPGSTIVVNGEKTKIYRLVGLPYAYESFEAPSAIIQKATGIIPAYTYGEYALTQVEVPEL